MNDLDIEYLPVGALKPARRNPRTHSKKQIRQIADSIEKFGFTNPVFVDAQSRVIAGHGPVEAAKLLGIAEVPTIRLDHMSEAQKRAYLIADNKLADNAGWDREILAIEFEELGDLDLGFDLTVTGFEMPEIDILIGERAKADDNQSNAADEVPDVESGKPAVTREGDIWQIGQHRLICGNALKPETHERLLGPEFEFKNLCVWNKTNGGMGSLYRSKHELVFVFKAGRTAHINNVELGRHGRYRTNVWDYAGINSFGKEREAELAMHPTVKPVAMIADAILDCSQRGGIVLDAFAGSGSTLVAAHQTGRRGYGVELDPHYCDVILRRMAKVCGLKAVHIATGQSFAEIERRRMCEADAVIDEFI